ncbi:MAG: MFS transporter [Proteobacteria bacterium]|nr:MFS transporter [Pseudomonadota bacterium]MCP4920245.1 MFS transporter [Pseudomonadota bacterium]
MLSLLRRRPAFRRFWLAELISQLGDWLSYVAVSLLALSEGPGEGALAVALVLAAHALPGALVAPWSGVLADRFDRRALLTVSHGVSAVLTVGMLAVAVDGQLVVELLLVLRAFASALAQPARTAVTARLVEPEELITANALEAATWSAMFALGMALGGLLASIGVDVALSLDAVTFVVAGALTLTLPSMRAGSRRGGSLGEAVALVRTRPELLDAVLKKVPLSLAGGAAWVVLNLWSVEVAFAGTAALTLALLQGVKGLGTGVGPVLHGRRLRGLEALGYLGMGLFLVTGQPLVLVAASFGWGVGVGANWVDGQVALQTRASDETLGRLASLDVLLFTGAQSLAALSVGALIEVGVAPGVAAAPFLVAALGLRAAASRAWRRRPAGRTPGTAGSWSA